MPNTIGQRIKRARTGAGLSLRQLADRVDKSHTAISKYERGEVTPNSAVLADLAEALDVRTEFFLRQSGVVLENPEFRRHPDLPKKELRRIEAKVLEKAERYFEFMGLFPQAAVPVFEIPDEIPNEITAADDIEAAADALRDAWDLGSNPIPNLIDEIETHGIVVFQVDFHADNRFDGLAARIDDRPIIVVGADWPGDRQRFTVAHELGHLVLDERAGGDLDIEPACNRFAGAFLAPETVTVKALGEERHWLEPRELHALKHEFGMSMSAWLYRARELDIINQATFDELAALFEERDWFTVEPGDPYNREIPRLFEQLVYHGLAEDLFGESKAAEFLKVRTSQVRDKRRFEI